MTSGHAPLAFPGSRTLAGWWPFLEGQTPKALWVAHLLLHHIEALVERVDDRAVDAVDRLILKALAVFPGTSLAQLDGTLHLGADVIFPLLGGLARNGLAREQEGRWHLTPMGREAIEQCRYRTTLLERQSFYFLAHDAPDRTHSYVALHRPVTVAWPPDKDWTFDPQWLYDCAARPADWKRTHGFPSNVVRIHRAGSAEQSSWKHILLDHPERLLAVLALVCGETGEALLGFSVRKEGWELQAQHPVLSLGSDWRDCLPELAGTPNEEAWRQAWHGWCQPRGLAAFIGDVRSLVLEGTVLRITVASRLMERLRSSRNEALRNEVWILAGSGRFRRAARVNIEPEDKHFSPSE